MNNLKNVMTWMIILSCMLNVGCATIPTSLKAEELDAIHNIAILTNPVKEGFSVLDHTGVWTRDYYVGHQYGAMGGMIQGAILSAEAHEKTRRSLEGNPKKLWQELSDFEIKDIIDESISSQISSKYKVAKLADYEGKLDRDNTYDKKYINELIQLCKADGADTLLKIDYTSGLAAYAFENASPAIDARVSVYHVESGKEIMRKFLYSDSIYQNNQVMEEFIVNGSEQYKIDILKGIHIMSLLVASEFGIDVDLASYKNTIEEIHMAVVTCKKPYQLDQDCSSLWGALRRIDINGKKVKIAGSSDGRFLLIMDDNLQGLSIMDVFSFGTTSHATNATKESIKSVKHVLSSSGIQIVNTIKMVSEGFLTGYLLELDKDGYSILKTYSI